MLELGLFSEALEKQWELWEIWRGPKGLDWARAYPPARLYVENTRQSATPRDIQKDEINELQKADPYFVAHNICDLLELIASTIPDIPLLADHPPSPNGWVYLQKPLPVGPPSQVERSVFGNPPRLKAFSWQPGRILKASQVIEGINITCYEDGSPFPYPLELLSWAFSVNWGSDWQSPDAKTFEAFPIEKDVSEKRSLVIRQYIIALFSFLKQPLVTISRERANRAARRRYQVFHQQEPPLIKVITLRTRQYRKGDETREVEWGCRWIVRGHWRQQWYPSMTAHRALWITPFIKGPEDKPLKKPRGNLFAVVR